jgi:hypothetical protein
MTKAPKNPPELNYRVRPRGRIIEGRVVFINPENNWARVDMIINKGSMRPILE